MGCWGRESWNYDKDQISPGPGSPPVPAPRSPALPARLSAARALLGAARLERSAHNEALSDVAAVPEPAGGSQGGRRGRKKPVGPGLLLPSTPTPPTRDQGAMPRGRGSCPLAGAGGPRMKGGTGGPWGLQ